MTDRPETMPMGAPYRLPVAALVAILAAVSVFMVAVGVLTRVVDRRRWRSPSESGGKFGADLTEATRCGIAEGLRPDTLDRIGQRIERGEIRLPPFEG